MFIYNERQIHQVTVSALLPCCDLFHSQGGRVASNGGDKIRRSLQARGAGVGTRHRPLHARELATGPGVTITAYCEWNQLLSDPRQGRIISLISVL